MELRQRKGKTIREVGALSVSHLWVAFADSVFLRTLYVHGALSRLHRLHGFAPSHFAFLILHL